MSCVRWTISLDASRQTKFLCEPARAGDVHPFSRSRTLTLVTHTFVIKLFTRVRALRFFELLLFDTWIFFSCCLCALSSLAFAPRTIPIQNFLLGGSGLGHRTHTPPKGRTNKRHTQSHVDRFASERTLCSWPPLLGYSFSLYLFFSRIPLEHSCLPVPDPFASFLFTIPDIFFCTRRFLLGARPYGLVVFMKNYLLLVCFSTAAWGLFPTIRDGGEETGSTTRGGGRGRSTKPFLWDSKSTARTGTRSLSTSPHGRSCRSAHTPRSI